RRPRQHGDLYTLDPEEPLNDELTRLRSSETWPHLAKMSPYWRRVHQRHADRLPASACHRLLPAVPRLADPEPSHGGVAPGHLADVMAGVALGVPLGHGGRAPSGPPTVSADRQERASTAPAVGDVAGVDGGRRSPAMHDALPRLRHG